MSISENVIAKIKKEKIKPKARYIFVLKNLFLWLMGSISIILGAISFSLIIYLFTSQNNLLLNSFGANIWEILMALIPLFWLVFLISFSFLFYFNLKKTKRAYKYSPLLIFFIGLIISFVLGASFYLLGFSKQIDTYLADRVELRFYNHYLNPQMKFWSQPSKGRLSGNIIDIKDSFLLIKDQNNQTWELVYDEKLINRQAISLELGTMIRAFGTLEKDNSFYLKEIMPCRADFKAGQRNRK